jgi:WD40 repeat protein
MIVDVAFSPDGRFLAAGVGSQDRAGGWGELRLLDIPSKRAATVGFPGHSDPVNSVAFSPDGKWLAGGTYDGSLRVFSVNRK